MKAAKAAEAEGKTRLGKKISPVLKIVEKVFQKFSILKPYYHGGKYNGKAMVTFMTCKGRVMDEMADALLSVPPQDQTHCSDEEIREYTTKFKTVLTIF